MLETGSVTALIENSYALGYRLTIAELHTYKIKKISLFLKMSHLRDILKV